jgi:DNA primase
VADRSGTIEEVREATDLVALIGEHVPLTPKGREHVCVCPFHDDHSPSMSVVTHKGNHFYKCHACGAAGDAFTFVMEFHRKDFPEALRYLADRAGITIPDRRQDANAPNEGGSRSSVRRANAFAAKHFRGNLQDNERGSAARAILAERGIDDATAERFEIGLAMPGYDDLRTAIERARADIRVAVEARLLRERESGGTYDAFRNRLMFPIADELGKTVAFGARRIDPNDEPKYLNSAESTVFDKSKTLYGLHLARRAIIDAGLTIVTEGYTDVIACHQAGLENVVGTLGTALTPRHAGILSRLCNTVVLLFDGDEAGQRAADRAVEVFFQVPVDVRICVLPGGLDPDDLLRQPGGLSQLEAAVDAAEDALAYRVRRFTASIANEGLAGREKRLQSFIDDLAAMGLQGLEGPRKGPVLLQISGALGVPVSALERSIRQSRRRPATPQATDSRSPHTAQTTAGSQMHMSQVENPATAPMHASDDGRLSSSLTVSRGRRVAERDLLAVLVCEPALAAQAIDLHDGRSGSVIDLISESDFLDGTAATVATRLWAMLRVGRTPTVPLLLDELTAEVAGDVATHARALCTKLYFQGRTRLDDGITIQIAADDLARCMAREADERNTLATHNTSPEQKLPALEELLQRRREQGDRPGAIVQGVRES